MGPPPRRPARTCFLTVDVAPPALTGALPAFIVSPPWDRGEGGTTAGELVEYELDNTSVVRPRSIGYIQFEEILGRAFEGHPQRSRRA